MNWTGGTLSRSRNANAKVSLSVKQKNHFAKARVKLQNRRQPPPEIQYFDFGEWKPESGVHDDRTSKLVKRKERASSQRTLDQFENVEGVVRKLKSLRPRNEARQRKEHSPINDRNKARKRQRSPIDDTEGHVLPSGIAIPPISPVIISSRPPSSASTVQAEPATKRTSKRPRTSTPSTSDEPDPLAVLDSVEAKRRKLLQENDWVGIERQRRLSKPIKMKFTDAKDRDLIGRRRPLNSSAVQNRWNMQGSKQMKIPLTASFSEKPRGLPRRFADEYWSAEDRMSIRIGSKGTNEGPISDEILDCGQSPGSVRRSSQSNLVQNFDYDNAGPTPKPQHRGREVTTPSASRDESSGPFHSLFSQEEVEQSGIAQLVEAATIADDDSLSLAEDELQLPEDYHFPEPEPVFRLVFEQTPQPRGRTSQLNDNSSPIVRDFAFIEGQLTGAAIENCNGLEEHISEQAPVEDAQASTSPLSIATSQYMQELENQSVGPGGQRLFAKNMANMIATARAQPTVTSNKAEDSVGATGDRERNVSVQPDAIQDKENIQPTEDEDEIWRSFINLDDVHEFESNQEQPTTTHIPHATSKAPVHEKQAPHHVSTTSTSQKAPPPPSSRDDDELIWQNFIFSDSNPTDEWNIEEARPESLPGSHISPYDPARIQPSMMAEAATSPVKQNPHLLDEMLDDSTLILDDASRYANASTTSTGSPGMTENVSSMPQQVSNPSDSPDQSYSVLATASPSTQSHSSNLPPPGPKPRLSNPSFLRVEASSSSSTPAHLIKYLSPPTGATTTTNNDNNPSSDELTWTPSRLSAATKEKVVFKKPSRYVGEWASDPPEPVHLGRRISKRGKKTEAAQRVKGKAGKGKGGRKSRNTEAEVEAETGMDEGDTDDIVDD